MPEQTDGNAGTLSCTFQEPQSEQPTGLVAVIADSGVGVKKTFKSRIYLMIGSYPIIREKLRPFRILFDKINPNKKFSPMPLCYEKDIITPENRNRCSNYGGYDVCRSVKELGCPYQGNVIESLKIQGDIIGYHECLPQKHETNPDN